MKRLWNWEGVGGTQDELGVEIINAVLIISNTNTLIQCKNVNVMLIDINSNILYINM